jgi:glucose/arabinose dehydrogenase
VATLATGFAVETIATGLATPSKIALAPDGRCFFTELKTGNVRVIAADGTLAPTPWATVTVQGAGSHQGLIGLALSPAFGSDGHLFVLFSAPADATHATDHMRLERFTDVAGVGTNATVILDDLPLATINNGCDLVFDLSGELFVSLGDANVSANSQDPLVVPGKVLRITPAGGIPASNPNPLSAQWCLGLRNTYGLAVHPITGGLFGLDNGPAQDDELNYLAAGKNFGWGAVGAIPGALAGLRIRVWPTEIVPTALAWHFGGPWGAAYADDLFLASYDDEEVLRFEMSGAAKTDIDVESSFLTFVPSMSDRKPLDLLVAADGALWVSTFTSIYRVDKL